jgi:hypothetical protein
MGNFLIGKPNGRGRVLAAQMALVAKLRGRTLAPKSNVAVRIARERGYKVLDVPVRQVSAKEVSVTCPPYGVQASFNFRRAKKYWARQYSFDLKQGK